MGGQNRPGKLQEGRARLRNDGVLNIGSASNAVLSFAGSPDGDFQLRMLYGLMETMWLPAGLSAEETEQRINAALAALESLAPRDAPEGMLAAQMIATHHAAMECFRRAMLPDQTREGRDHSLKHAQRLTKAYLDQVAALDKHRGRGRQKITVEHVTVQAGGQAIVGSVDAGAAADPRASWPPGSKEAPDPRRDGAQGAPSIEQGRAERVRHAPGAAMTSEPRVSERRAEDARRTKRSRS